MNVIDFNRVEHDVIQKPVPTFWHHALDHDVFSSNRAEDMNVIDSNNIEHDVVQKPVPTFWHHALAPEWSAPGCFADLDSNRTGSCGTMMLGRVPQSRCCAARRHIRVTLAFDNMRVMRGRPAATAAEA